MRGLRRRGRLLELQRVGRPELRRLRRRDLEDERRAARPRQPHVPEQVRLRSGERVWDAVRLSGDVE